MPDFYVGQHLTHPGYGPCTVTFVGVDYVGIELGGSANVLVKKDAFLEVPATGEQVVQPIERPLSWPESTFIHENDNAQHFPGSHWKAFFEDHTTIVNQLPEILEKAELWVGGVNSHDLRPMPYGWTHGVVLAWPNHRQGLMIGISISDEGTVVESFYPFVSEGRQHNLILRRVTVLRSGVNAQIEIDFGDATITFFDIAYTKSRLWYEAGRNYEFILSGIAYDVRPADVLEIPFNPNPDQVAWEHALATQRGEAVTTNPTTLSLRGMAMFMNVDGWDADEYQFRGPVKSVREVVGDVLGQKGWIVQAIVMRFDELEANLDILITQRAWQSDKPPKIGQDIKGTLWLQGYLWSAPI